MKLEEIKKLMAQQNKGIIEVKHFKKHDTVNYWARFPNAEDPIGLRCEVTLRCRIEDLPEKTVMEYLVGTSINNQGEMKP